MPQAKKPFSKMVGLIEGIPYVESTKNTVVKTVAQMKAILGISGEKDIIIESLINAESVAPAQQPTGLDIPLQIEFGAAQGIPTDDVQILANGDIVFNKTGSYTIRSIAHYGRTGGDGTSLVRFYGELDSTSIGAPFSAKMSNANVLIPASISFSLNVTAGQILKIFVVRDGTGSNSGGLFSTISSTPGVADTPSARIDISKLTITL